ncbi:MAG: hypothetical protein MUO19_01635 [Dehalococcoidales bacterium]|nr:hypothetical protein [Dehalococcoidales bacterium]
MPEEESGFDELMRLSQQFTRQKKDHDKAERQRAEQGKKVRGVLQGLKDLNVSMAVSQLDSIAGPDTIKRVETLKTTESTEDLRKLISSLADDLEHQLGAFTADGKDTASLVNTMRTINILMDLYFSFH